MDEDKTPATGDSEGTQENTGEDIQVPEGARNPDAVKNAIRAEREAAKAARAEADAAKREAGSLREKLAQATEEVESLKAKLAEARDELAKVRPLVDRYEVAAAKGLDLRLAKRLQGDTREALEKDADELLSLQLGGDSDFDGGARQPVPPPKKRPEEAHNDFLLGLLGRQEQ